MSNIILLPADFFADKSEHKANREGFPLWSSIINRRGNTKINKHVKEVV